MSATAERVCAVPAVARFMCSYTNHPGIFARRVNHSCGAFNMGANLKKGQMIFVALRDVAAGEELLIK
jgi:hypothetical protein